MIETQPGLYEPGLSVTILRMSTMRPWAMWRRLQYGVGFAVFWMVVGSLGYYLFIYTPGDCFDEVMNEDERGADCGGRCVRICASDVTAPQIVWADSFKIVDGQYNATAYVENKNAVAGTQALRYKFELYDGTKLVAERAGTTVLPPNSVYPIFEGRIYTSSDTTVTNTKLILEPVEIWQPAMLGREQFRTSNLNLLSPDASPRLEARIDNTELSRAEKIEVVATLFNTNGKPVTASQTFIEALEGRASKDVVFTWPNPIAKTIKSCAIPSDLVIGIDLSGSMNNDGGTPPQPISGAIAAARDFALRLAPDDQASVVTFASGATTVSLLNQNHTETATLIGALSIAPAEETGFTNTPAAIAAAAAELASARHSGDSRRALVLLTDGLPTAPGDTTSIVEVAKQAALELAKSGVEVYVIGVGKGVDVNFIKTLTEDPNNAFYAPTGGDLDAIYQKITGALCESGATRIDVVAKTPTNFTPLR